MTNRVSAARSFMVAHARALDRRRFELLFDGGDAEFVLGALRAYRNPDEGYGHRVGAGATRPRLDVALRR